MRLINSARTADLSLKMDDAVKMTTGELLAKVEKAYTKVGDFETKTFELAKLSAEEAYKTTVIATEEAVYLAKYMEFNGIIEGGLAVAEYGGLCVVAKTVELIAKGVTLAQNLTNKALKSDDVLAIAKGLGVDVEALKDEEGNVTVDSVGAYINKAAQKGMDKLTQDMRDNLDKAIEKLENSKVEIQDKPLTSDVANKIQSLLEKIDIKDLDINSIVVTVEDLKNVSLSLANKAGEIRAQMDASLSESQKSSIVAAQKNAVSKLTSARDKYNKALAQAEKDAKLNLQYLKNSRLDKLGQQA